MDFLIYIVFDRKNQCVNNRAFLNIVVDLVSTALIK